MILRHYLCTVFVFRRNKGLPGNVHLGFLTCVLERGKLECDVITSTSDFRVSSQNEGLLEESDTLSPEAVQLFSSLTSLQPKIFAHLQAIQLQPALCPVEDTAQPTTTPPELSSRAPPQPVLLSPSQFLQSSGSGGESISLCDPPTMLGMSQLVSVTSMTNAGAEGGITQILLEDGQAIPVQIVDPASIALTSSADNTSDK